MIELLKFNRSINTIKRWGGWKKAKRPVGVHDGNIVFKCNICGTINQTDIVMIGRETRSCWFCGSTVRNRSIINMLSVWLFGKSYALPEFPVDKGIYGVGLSDISIYAKTLARKMSYTNTFYHKRPHLDIHEVPERYAGKFDFIINSDVFEHILPPVSAAFANCRRMLKPGGFMLFTVPYVDGPGETTEFFPNIYDSKIVSTPEGRVLINKTREGVVEKHHDLTFHGGGGATLSMRMFTRRSIVAELEKAGFTDAKFYSEPRLEHGICYRRDSVFPILASVSGGRSRACTAAGAVDR